MHELSKMVHSWCIEYSPLPFASIKVGEGVLPHGCVSKIDISTGKVVIDIKTLLKASKQLEVRPDLLLYYVLGHEAGHLLYNKLKLDGNEERFAHEVACKLSKCFVLSQEDVSALKRIEGKIVGIA